MSETAPTTADSAPIATGRLRWKTFITPGAPTVNDDIPPGETVRMWSPITSTLIFGSKDAVLIDTPTTAEQAHALANWVEASGKNLTTIYATHGHGDHFFGTGILQARFPSARAIAAPEVVKHMHDQMAPAMVDGFWSKRFPGQIPANIVAAEALDSDHFYLEGHELQIVSVGHSDMDDTTCLYVPSLKLLVAGDVVYNGVHQYLTESPTHEKRLEWLAALDRVETLGAETIIAGHKRPENADSPDTIAQTRQYILDFDRLVGETATTLELYQAMLALYPDRVNPGALWGSARMVKTV